MTYWDVPSGIGLHAGETVSVLVVFEDTVRVWPAPGPAVIVTRRPAHWLIVHALVPDLLVSWSAVLVCVITYLDVPSGVVIQGETVSVLAVLEVTVFVWPAPVPAVIVTGRRAHRRAGDALGCALFGSWGVVLVFVVRSWE